MPEEEPEQILPAAEKWLPGKEEFPSEEEIEMRIETAGEEAAISPFDPDFILFALPFAFVTDIILAILEIAALFTGVVKIVSIIINAIAFVIFGIWMNWRLGRIMKNKKDYADALRNNVQKGMKQLSKYKKMGNVSPEAFQRYMRLYGKQMGKIGKVAAKTITKPLGKILVRGGLAFLGGAIFILGLLPFWTITVVLCLREK